MCFTAVCSHGCGLMSSYFLHWHIRLVLLPASLITLTEIALEGRPESHKKEMPVSVAIHMSEERWRGRITNMPTLASYFEVQIQNFPVHWYPITCTFDDRVC